MMRLSIDAWLERNTPYIRLIESESGHEVLYLDSHQIQALFESGDITPQELEKCFTSDEQTRRELVTALIDHSRASSANPVRLQAAV
jgi:hypothetical protein